MVFTLQTAAIQLGFILGPVGGAAIMQNTNFQTMSIVLGAVMVLYSPLLTLNRGITHALECKHAEARVATEPVAADELAVKLEQTADA